MKRLSVNVHLDETDKIEVLALRETSSFVISLGGQNSVALFGTASQLRWFLASALLSLNTVIEAQDA